MSFYFLVRIFLLFFAAIRDEIDFILNVVLWDIISVVVCEKKKTIKSSTVLFYSRAGSIKNGTETLK